jgi:uncharacterized repeat protein (TIGR01451 family)
MAQLAMLFFSITCIPLWAIPPDTPVTNTATASYQVGGADYSASGSATVRTDPAAGNSPPFALSLEPATVPENSPGSVVGTIVIADPDPGDTHVVVVDDPRFIVVGNTLQLAADVALDFESTSTVTVEITVTDPEGATYTQQLEVAVLDVNETPESISLSSSTLVAGRPGADVGLLQVVDPDADDSHTFTVDDNRFEVIDSTLKLRDDISLPLGATAEVTVTATDSGGLSYTQTFTLTATPPGGGGGENASITALQLASGVDFAQQQSINPSSCVSGGGVLPLPPPLTLTGDSLQVPGSGGFLPTSIVKSDDVLFVQVADPQANVNPLVVDQVLVRLRTPDADEETIAVSETGVDSGVFIGYLQTSRSAAQPGNCILEVVSGTMVSLAYVADDVDVATLDILVDPFGRVFDSASGTLINGATITLLDASTNQPAQVFADDGVTDFPATQVSGDPFFDNDRGAYRFPFVQPGEYLLQVSPPNRFAFPSAASDAQLQILPGAPFALGAGSRGQGFIVPVGPAVQIDIPLDLQPVVPTSSTIAVLADLPSNGNSTSVQVTPTSCFDGNTFTNIGDPVTLAQGVLPVPANLALTPVDRLARNDVLFISVVDPDQDLDPFSPDQITVEVLVAETAERETLQLSETNDSTGVFVGYLQTAGTSAVAANCQLEASPGASILVNYADVTDNTDTASAEVVYDPGFSMVSSASGTLVSGASVTLIDASTGLAADAAVFGADGVSAFPATIVVGGEALDASGARIDFAPGTFYFPLILPGEYRFEVTAPVSYTFPSAVDDEALNRLPGGPFNLVQGSRGEAFTVTAGIPAGFDLPLDPISAEVFVTKQASKQTAAVGDFLQYRIQVENVDASGTVSDLLLSDQLPTGFRYVAGSLQVAGVSGVQPELSSDGEQFDLALGELSAGSSIALSYVVEITAGAKLGPARNRASVAGTGIGQSNVAFADVEVREDLLQSKAILIGQVYANGCPAGDAATDAATMEQQTGQGLADIRIWLEDGTFVVTDIDGKYHLEGLEPGTHVVALDTATLPGSHELVLCEDNTRFAANPGSQFIDVQGGTLWRADFYTAPKPDQSSEIVSRLDAQADDGKVTYTYWIKGGAVPLQNLRTTIMLGDQLAYIEGSAKLNGQPIGDPSGLGMGAPTFKLPDTTDHFNYALTFETFVKTPKGHITSKAVSRFATRQGQHRSEVSLNELSLNWPASLVMIAESVTTSDNKALRAARQTNAQRLREIRPAEEPAEPVVAIASAVMEPSRGSNYNRGSVARKQVSVRHDGVRSVPYELPEQDRGEAPAFNLSWLSQNPSVEGIVWPPENYNPALPAIEVAVAHDKSLKAVVLVDGKIVNPVTYEGTATDHDAGVSLSRWDNVTISEHDSVIEAQLLNSAGEVVERYKRSTHFSGAPARAEWVKDESYLIADGLYPPVIAVRLFDRAGYPLRPGTTGEFSVSAPFMALDKAKHLEALDNKFSNQRYQVLRDGIAYIQLEPTTSTGEVEVKFQFDPVRSDTVRARMIPGNRDWIMVGLLEGTYAQNDLSGNLKSLGKQNLEDETLTDGRMAFYGKGMVRGDWLLTVAYDTDKKFERELREQIDPNQFYTLYGDGTEQLFDAQSQRKLYLKLERARFSALFGDFDTNFERSELARYDRRLNGLNLGFFGEHVEAKVFASETDQALVRDELRGDGTSGVYRLSNQRLVANSETVRIVTRDRFATQNIIDSVELNRFVDYTIDFSRGTLIFKQPVFSQDENFNPIFIEVEYEVAYEGVDEKIVAGSRVAYRLDDQDSEVALTYINDDTEGQGGSLIAADLTWQMNTQSTLTVEVAQTDTDLNDEGNAYLLQLEHADSQMAGRIYAREQEQTFGLGNQSALEAGTRKIGLEGEYRWAEGLLLRGQAFEQTALAEGSRRRVVNALGEWRQDKTKLSTGLQAVSEETASGDSADATQLLFGVAQNVYNNKLMLRADAEIDVSSGSGSTDYPSRAIFGAEYEVFNEVNLIAEQELTWGDDRDTQDTRFGVRARPWTGGDVNSFVTQAQGENGRRLFATTGLLQQWRINERWLYDIGFDRVQTLSESGAADEPRELLFNPNVPPTSGSIDNDFTAFFTGFGYRHEAWDVSSRFEWHAGDMEDKWNVLIGANHQLAEGRVVSASMSWLNEESATGVVQDNLDLRVGAAWRPFDSAWSFLNRTDLVFERREDAAFDTRTRKWVNNFNANYKPGLKHQLAFQVAFKYVVENIDAEEYDGFTSLLGAEYRYDIGSRWDVSMRSAVLSSHQAGTARYSYGAAIGHSIRPNMWLSVGYNVEGFEDDDFIAADYTAKGPYLKLRMKFDQDLAKRFLEFTGLAQRRQIDGFANGR